MDENSSFTQSLVRIITLCVITIFSLLIIIPVVGFINNARVCNLNTTSTTVSQEEEIVGYIQFINGDNSSVYTTISLTEEEAEVMFLEGGSPTDNVLMYIEVVLLLANKTYLYSNFFCIYNSDGSYSTFETLTQQQADPILMFITTYSLFYLTFYYQSV